MTDSFVPLLSASDCLVCVYRSVRSRVLGRNLHVWPAILCAFVCDFQFSTIIFTFERNILLLYLTIIKTFSFVSSCVSEIHSFVILSPVVNSIFLGGSIFVSEFYSMFFYFCL